MSWKCGAIFCGMRSHCGRHSRNSPRKIATSSMRSSEKTQREYDEEEDDYRDLDEPIDIAIFDTEDQARDFVARLESLLEVLHG